MSEQRDGLSEAEWDDIVSAAVRDVSETPSWSYLPRLHAAVERIVARREAIAAARGGS